jgi:hypothetical protein
MTLNGVEIVFDDGLPRGVLLIDGPDGLEIYSVPLNPRSVRAAREVKEHES